MTKILTQPMVKWFLVLLNGWHCNEKKFQHRRCSCKLSHLPNTCTLSWIIHVPSEFTLHVQDSTFFRGVELIKFIISAAFSECTVPEKYPYSPQGRSLESSRGRESQKAKFSREKIKLNWKY